MVVMLAIIMMMVSVMSLKHNVKIISMKAMPMMLVMRSRNHSTNAADPTMMMMVMLIYHIQDKGYSQEIMTFCDLFSRNVICRR